MARDPIPHLQQRITCTRDGVENVNVVDFSGAFAALNLDNHYDFRSFKQGLRIDMKRMDPDVVEFDLIGVDAPVANALRRILISEVATVAIESVILTQNTGVIQDENLVHRLGLIPLCIDPDQVPFTKNCIKTEEPIIFSLRQKCTTQETLSVYSRDLIWEPCNEAQRAKFAGREPRPVDGNILITKLARGQEIIAECYCAKGYGKEHAKWQPVNPVWYRLLPDIKVQNVSGADAETLRDRCPKKVFDIEDGHAVVKNARACSTCRECLDAIPDGRVDLGKIKNHFLFTVEATGQIPAPELIPKAINRLKEKCQAALEFLRKP